MRTLEPSRLKPSRLKRMKESLKIEKEARQLYAEFERHGRDRKRLARKARKFSNKVRRTSPDLRLMGTEQLSLYDTVDEIADSLYLDRYEDEDPVNQTESSFKSLFNFLSRLTDVPWLKGSEE